MLVNTNGAKATYRSLLDDSVEHHHPTGPLLPHHLPEVATCVRERPLNAHIRGVVEDTRAVNKSSAEHFKQSQNCRYVACSVL